MDANEIIIQIKTLPPHDKQRIAKMMSPFWQASETVMKMAELFHMLSMEEKICFIELIKWSMWWCEMEEHSEETLVI